MSLTTGRGPLSGDPAGFFTPPVAPGTVYVEPHPRRIQGVRANRTVIDTEDAIIVHRPDSTLTYAFPAEQVGDLVCEPEAAAPGYVRVAWDAVDTWFEEGRELVSYPPNPYHRVDCRATMRRLRVEVGGVVLVDTDDTTIVFETALAPKLYVAAAHVRTELLRRSTTTSYCNYKGWATYWSAVVDRTVVDDVAWTYDDPLPESMPIKGAFCFDAERVDMVAALPNPVTVRS